MFPWKFQQLYKSGSNTDIKTLELADYAAPFGRPRKDPVITETIESRVTQVRYPGNSGAPTRHAFGVGWEETELKGRWMTKSLPGTTTAIDVADQWIEFIKDERDLRISWGSIASWSGFLKKLELGRESEHEIAWKMTILLDQKEDTQQARDLNIGRPALANDVSDLNFWIAAAGFSALPDANSLQPDFFEALDNIAAECNKASAALRAIVEQMDTYEKAAFSTIAHFRSVATGFQGSIVEMRGVVANAAIDSIVVARDAKSDIEWLTFQVQFDKGSAELMAILAVMDRNAELAGKGEPSKMITARSTDTWETLSLRATGSYSRAREIRDLNGAQYGQEPETGMSYLVP